MSEKPKSIDLTISDELRTLRRHREPPEIVDVDDDDDDDELAVCLQQDNDYNYALQLQQSETSIEDECKRMLSSATGKAWILVKRLLEKSDSNDQTGKDDDFSRPKQVEVIR